MPSKALRCSPWLFVHGAKTARHWPPLRHRIAWYLQRRERSVVAASTAVETS